MSALSGTDGAHLVVVSLMVKDEEASIVATLASLWREGIRSFFILDTGSTDNTVELAGAFFKTNSLAGFIEQEPFVDFATSRNRALALTKKRFAHIPFILMPDAEWYLHQGRELLAFCAQELASQTPLYLLNVHMNGMEFGAARLFRTASQVCFTGVVHEAPNAVASVKVPSPVFFEVNASAKGVEKSRRRWQQDLALLSSAFAKNPKDPRTAFYLGQTHECLNDLPSAYQAYRHREHLSGWDEENFITLYRLGGVAQRMMPQKSAKDWALAMDYYLKAHALRPHRIEPLLRIAEYYWPENIQACYLFARHAYSMPFPSNDVLFVERHDYDYKRYEIMSRCAWYLGEFALGEEATLRALNVDSEVPHLQRNLKLYQQKLRKQ